MKQKVFLYAVPAVVVTGILYFGFLHDMPEERQRKVASEILERVEPEPIKPQITAKRPAEAVQIEAYVPKWSRDTAVRDASSGQAMPRSSLTESVSEAPSIEAPSRPVPVSSFNAAASSPALLAIGLVEPAAVGKVHTNKVLTEKQLSEKRKALSQGKEFFYREKTPPPTIPGLIAVK